MTRISKYIKGIQREYSDQTTEHSLRHILKELLETYSDKKLTAINEPGRIKTDEKHSIAPDFLIKRNDIEIGCVETKNIGKDLKAKEYKEQFSIYKKTFSNLLITDYIRFEHYLSGKLKNGIEIAKVTNGKIEAIKENQDHFKILMEGFCNYKGYSISSSYTLAKHMAARTRLFAKILYDTLDYDIKNEHESALLGQYKSFKKNLIPDMKTKGFSDIYAQTISYGMLWAHMVDPVRGEFSKERTNLVIPSSIPFLSGLFKAISSQDFDERINWVVESLTELFGVTDLHNILDEFRKDTGQNDALIDFYERFLGEYDSALRKVRGVWYTPKPVVDFIVRSVDNILCTDFKMEGLSDASKRGEYHKVQILDPAAGTGTFLASVVKYIYDTKFKDMQGVWSSYVKEHLIPRLNGFEILMASYAMAHLHLYLLFELKTDFRPVKEDRFRIYLTNALEEGEEKQLALVFSEWFSEEVNEANKIKRKTPLMVVLGNPPYSISTQNKGQWITKLIANYKDGLNEKKLNLDDDYIKFIRYGQYLIDKNKEGILAYISNNSFLDGVTHRQMRKSLLESFDKIYILDLHGSARKKEVCPDGGKDENVFDIMQGVSINIFVKRTNNKSLATVYHHELWGKRDIKFARLEESNIDTINWTKLEIKEPYYFFVPKDFALQEEYDKGFKIDELFTIYSSGIETQNDKLCIHYGKDTIRTLLQDITTFGKDEVKRKYNITKESRDWKSELAYTDLKNNSPRVVKIAYRPFDYRYTAYTGQTKGFLAYPGYKVMKHMLGGENVGLVCSKRLNTNNFKHISITKHIWERGGISAVTSENGYLFPLYLYPDDGMKRVPNLRMEIVDKIGDIVELSFRKEKEGDENRFSPIDVLDYIYAVLHSPKYRSKYKEFLKIDFPRLPYPKDREYFMELVRYGKELRESHLLEKVDVNADISFPIEDGCFVDRVRFVEADGISRVYINKEQYFEGVGKGAWEFYIGGYQPAKKWLKVREGRALSYEDIMDYIKVIKAIVKTKELMIKIDLLLKK